MHNLQLSFFATAAIDACDINAVDAGVIHSRPALTPEAAKELADRTVDDWVFGLGFTNWKAVIDHAIQTAHFELFASEDGLYGLRKYGFRNAPIPRLPRSGVTYIQQQLLIIAGERQGKKAASAPRLITVSNSAAFKCIIASGDCRVIAIVDGEKHSVTVSVSDLQFSDTDARSIATLAGQLEAVLGQSGVESEASKHALGKAVAHHLLSIIATLKISRARAEP